MSTGCESPSRASPSGASQNVSQNYANSDAQQLESAYPLGTILNAFVTNVHNVQQLRFFMFVKNTANAQHFASVRYATTPPTAYKCLRMPREGYVFGLRLGESTVLRAVRIRTMCITTTREVFLPDIGRNLVLEADEMEMYHLPSKLRKPPGLAVSCQLRGVNDNVTILPGNMRTFLRGLLFRSVKLRVDGYIGNVLKVQLLNVALEELQQWTAELGQEEHDFGYALKHVILYRPKCVEDSSRLLSDVCNDRYENRLPTIAEQPSESNEDDGDGDGDADSGANQVLSNGDDKQATGAETPSPSSSGSWSSALEVTFTPVIKKTLEPNMALTKVSSSASSVVGSEDKYDTAASALTTATGETVVERMKETLVESLENIRGKRQKNIHVQETLVDSLEGVPAKCQENIYVERMKETLVESLEDIRGKRQENIYVERMKEDLVEILEDIPAKRQENFHVQRIHVSDLERNLLGRRATTKQLPSNPVDSCKPKQLCIPPISDFSATQIRPILGCSFAPDNSWKRDFLPALTLIDNRNVPLNIPREELLTITPTYIGQLERFFGVVHRRGECYMQHMWTEDEIPSSSRFSATRTPYVFDVVLAKHSGDFKWYRAKVIEILKDQQKVRVFFVDYGGVEYVNTWNLAYLSRTISNLPFQAVLFRLNDLVDVTSTKAERTYGVDFLRTSLLKKTLNVRVINYRNDEATICFEDARFSHVPSTLLRKGIMKHADRMKY